MVSASLAIKTESEQLRLLMGGQDGPSESDMMPFQEIQ